jgi:hypothetical protein
MSGWHNNHALIHVSFKGLHNTIRFVPILSTDVHEIVTMFCLPDVYSVNSNHRTAVTWFYYLK